MLLVLVEVSYSQVEEIPNTSLSNGVRVWSLGHQLKVAICRHHHPSHCRLTKTTARTFPYIAKPQCLGCQNLALPHGFVLFFTCLFIWFHQNLIECKDIWRSEVSILFFNSSLHGILSVLSVPNWWDKTYADI